MSLIWIVSDGHVLRNTSHWPSSSLLASGLGCIFSGFQDSIRRICESMNVLLQFFLGMLQVTRTELMYLQGFFRVFGVVTSFRQHGGNFPSENRYFALQEKHARRLLGSHTEEESNSCVTSTSLGPQSKQE